MGRTGVRFAAVLRTHLHDAVVLFYRITRCLGLGKNIAHRLFDVGIFIGLCRQFQNRGVRVLGSGNHYGVNIRQCEDILQIFEGSRRTSIVFSIFLNCAVTAHVPQVADSRHFYVLTGLMLGDYPIEFMASVAYPDVGKRNSIVSPENSCV